MSEVQTFAHVGYTYPAGLQPAQHVGADLESRESRLWRPYPGSADADLLPELEPLRSRARDIARNNGIASGIVETFKDNIVGYGLRLSSTPDWRLLGKTKEWAEEWSTFVEGLWREYSETTAFDAAGQLTFHQATRQVVGAMLTHGESLALALWLPDVDPHTPYATKFQMVESDRLSNPTTKQDSKTLRGGVEIDGFGRPVAYHIKRTHPGDIYLTYNWSEQDWERIPAATEWGRKQVLHVYEKERPGQTRGKPLFSSILEKFRMLDKYQRTELQAAIVNAMIAAIVETPLPPEQVAAMFGGDVEGEQFQKWLAQKQEYMAELKGGSMIHTMPGEHVTPFTPARPATAFAPFCDAIARQIGTGVNLPYELVMRDFSKTNYSSARAALLEAWRFFMSRRSWLSTCWASPVYELWLEEAINEGIIEAPRFYEFRYAYSKCKWIGPGRGWIDPLKEAQSSEVRMRNLVSTLEQECAEQGLDWEEVVSQRAAEFARIEELGLDKYLKPATPKTDIPGEKEPVDTETDVEEAPEVPMAVWRRMWQRFGSFIGVQDASV